MYGATIYLSTSGFKFAICDRLLTVEELREAERLIVERGATQTRREQSPPPTLPKNVAEIAPEQERPAGAGLEHVPPSDLYAARTAQLERERWQRATRGRRG